MPKYPIPYTPSRPAVHRYPVPFHGPAALHDPFMATFPIPYTPSRPAVLRYNVYPFMALLPFTTAGSQNLVFSFSCNWGQILSIGPDNVLRPFRGLPAWPQPGLCSAMSAMGTATLTMMSWDNNWETDLAMFGGAKANAGVEFAWYHAMRCTS